MFSLVSYQHLLVYHHSIWCSWCRVFISHHTFSLSFLLSNQIWVALLMLCSFKRHSIKTIFQRLIILSFRFYNDRNVNFVFNEHYSIHSKLFVEHRGFFSFFFFGLNQEHIAISMHFRFENEENFTQYIYQRKCEKS